LEPGASRIVLRIGAARPSTRIPTKSAGRSEVNGPRSEMENNSSHFGSVSGGSAATAIGDDSLTARQTLSGDKLHDKGEQSVDARYEALFRVSQAITAHREPQELFQVLAKELHQVVTFDFVGVFFYNEESNTFEIPIFEADKLPRFVLPSDFPIDETMTWWIHRHQKPVLISSTAEDRRFPRVMELLRQFGARSACLLPLTTVNRRLGSLGFGSLQANAYSESEVRYLTLVADEVALAIDNAMIHQEQERTKEELREQKAHFEKLFELAPEPIVLRDTDNRILRVNKEFTRLFGFTVEEAVGRNISELILPDAAWNESESLRETLKNGQRVDIELVRKRKDGTLLNVSFVAAPVSLPAGDPQIYGIYRDITDQKKAEDALKRSEAYLAEGQRLSHTGSWARNVSTGGIYFSQEGYRIFGLDPARTRMSLEIFLSRVHPEDRSDLEQAIEKSVRDASDIETDYRIIRDDGSLRHIHTIGHPVKGPAGQAIEFVGTLIDVTEQHQSRMALEKAFEEIKTLKDQLYQENVALRREIDETSMFEEIVGKSAALQKVLKQVETVAPTESTVLILGETGTGKELIARAIHNLGPRRENAFVKLNCAAIPTGLLESELFGHEKGAFTGAIAQRIGRFELADRGTVFLDEIGEVPLELQPKLLRVLQEREFERLGSSRTLRSDARLIAASNRDLEAMVQEQKFRPDLFYRLNVFPIRVPALRERPEDIPLLVRHFAEHFSRRINKPITLIPSETMSALIQYEWPGNIRELQNVIERAVILSNRGLLRVSRAELGAQAGAGSMAVGPRVPVKVRSRNRIPNLNREQVIQALREARGRVGGSEGAAALLGLKRTTLIAQMKKLGVTASTVIDKV
jgi:PAS domain S-box-containing protein